MKTAVTMPISIIGTLILLLIVFVVIIVSYSGTFSGYWNKFMRIFGITTGPTSLKAWQIKCSQFCQTLDGQFESETDLMISLSNYCTFVVDTEEFGGIKLDYCYKEDGDALVYYCEIYLSDGSTKKTIDCT